MGDDTVNIVTRNRPRFMAWANWSKQSEAEHPHRRPLLLRQEVLQMPPDEQLILRPGMRPIRAKKIRWWQEREFIARCKAPPQIPELTVEIPIDDGSDPIVQPTRRRISATQMGQSLD